MALFGDVLAPACISSDSPGFLAFIPEAPTKASQLFDVVVSASAIVGSSWMEASGAVYAENQALRWISDLAGLPDGAGGCFVSGGSAANLSALVAAREAAAARRSDRPARWRVALGDQAHSSLTNTMRIMDAVPLVVPSAGDRLTGAELRDALDRDPDPGSVFAVVATGGTTNTGQIDDLDGIAAVARERGLWFHVDGAYGLAALAAPSVRDRFRGVEHADSLVVDPHKWLFAPFDCAALLYRDPELARRAHIRNTRRTSIRCRPVTSGTRRTTRTTSPGACAGCRSGSHSRCTAPTRTPPRSSRRSTSREHAARQIDAAPHLELILEPELTVVLWRRPGWTTTDYATWSRRLLADQIAFVLPTTWHGETVARAVFLHPDCPPEVIDHVIASMV